MVLKRIMTTKTSVRRIRIVISDDDTVNYDDDYDGWDEKMRMMVICCFYLMLVLSF